MSGIEGTGVQGGGSSGIPTTAEVVTVDDETGTLPNSRQLVGGTNITLDTATPGDLIINTTAQGSTIPATVQGDTLYASAVNTMTALAKDANATRYVANTGTSNNPAWAQVNLANGVTGDLPFANLTQGSALSVLGVTGNATADVASIAAASDDQVLRRSGTTVAFGAVNLAGANAVTGTLPVGSGGTGIASGTSGGVPYYSATNTIASSGALTATAVVLGGGAGVAPNVSSNLLFAGSTMTLGDSTSGTIIPPAAATTSSAGAPLILQGGPGGSVSGTGGPARLFGGVGQTQGGACTITGGAGGAGSNSGGGVTITGGAGQGANPGGVINIAGGAAGATGNGGGIGITAAGGGATSGNAGNITLTCGTPVDGTGGTLTLTATSGVGSNRSGGNVTITAGNATGSGTQGALTFVNCTTTGAQTATFTAANKPGTGTTAPSLWLRMVVGATTYYVPMWQ